LSGSFYGVEDCLFLSVYVPDMSFEGNSTKLPVMVWITGGGFRTGGFNYYSFGPNQFMQRGVIMVALNYRLGVLGFLSMGSEMVPGNAGLRDQVLALEWIHENIVSFGGDPDLITIFGESAGAVSVHLHILSPLSDGLFKRAILQSGSALSEPLKVLPPERALGYSNEMAKVVGCHQEENVLSCMQGIEFSNFVISSWLFNGAFIWWPVLDTNFTVDSFLPGYPEQLMSSGEFNTNIDIIIGTNTDEGIVLVDPLRGLGITWEDYKNNFIENGPYKLFNIANASDVTDDLINKTAMIVDFYLGSTENINIDNIQGIMDLLTDSWFLYGTYKTVKYMTEHNVTVYQYVLSYEGQYSYTMLFGQPSFGVAHVDDIMYLFDPNFIAPTLNEDDATVRNIMVTAWTNFAANGEPTSTDSESSWNEQTCSECVQSYWNISGASPGMATSTAINERMEFWDSIMNMPTSLPTLTPVPSSQCSSYVNDISDMVFKGVGSNCRAGMDSTWPGGLTCNSPYIVCLPQENTLAVDGFGGEAYKSLTYRYSVEECLQECSRDQRCMGVEFVADLNSSLGDCNLIDVLSLEITSEVEGFTFDSQIVYNSLDISITGGDVLCFAKDASCYPYFEAEELNDVMLKCYCPNNRKGYYTKKVRRTVENTRYCGGDDSEVNARIKKAQANRMFHLCENWCLFLTENPEAESWYWDPWHDCWREQYAGVGPHMSYCNRVIRSPNAIEMQFLNYRKNMFCQSPQPTQSPSIVDHIWYLADEGDSCDDACMTNNKVCEENLTAGVTENNVNAGSYFAQAGVTCVNEEVGNVDWALPGYEVSSGICLIRSSSTENTGCNWAIGLGYQRLCACA